MNTEYQLVFKRAFRVRYQDQLAQKISPKVARIVATALAKVDALTSSVPRPKSPKPALWVDFEYPSEYEDVTQ